LHGVKGISKNPDFAIQILPYVITKKSKNASLSSLRAVVNGEAIHAFYSFNPFSSSLRAACGEAIQYCEE
jgi:hypothetical protein